MLRINACPSNVLGNGPKISIEIFSLCCIAISGIIASACLFIVVIFFCNRQVRHLLRNEILSFSYCCRSFNGFVFAVVMTITFYWRLVARWYQDHRFLSSITFSKVYPQRLVSSLLVYQFWVISINGNHLPVLYSSFLLHILLKCFGSFSPSPAWDLLFFS